MEPILLDMADKDLKDSFISAIDLLLCPNIFWWCQPSLSSLFLKLDFEELLLISMLS